GLGVVVMLVARFVKAGAACPQCNNSLLWKKGRFGTGHASFGVKSACPECGLDLNTPWTQPDEGQGLHQPPAPVDKSS
ncbi:MAG: hypothetical protein ACK5JT_15850, partial [Hyphomicrobiaceae bacterium]